MQFHTPPYNLEEIKIELTYRCPLVCIHCSSDASPISYEEMDNKTALDLVAQATNMGVNEIAFSGGEPMIYNGINTVVEKAASGSANVIIYTSGYIHDFSKKIKILKKRGLNKVIFSLYSSFKQKHESITRKRGSYNLTLHSIRETVEIGLDCEIHFVALRRNYKDLIDLTNLTEELGIKRISVLRFVPQGRGFLLQNDGLLPIQYIELKKIIQGLRQKGHDIRTGSPFNFLLLSNQPVCYSAINRLIIAPDLRIYPCDAFKQIKAEELVKTSQYSVLNGVTLNECWERSPFLQAIRDYLTTPFVESCEKCIFLEDCLSGCLAQKVLTYGSLEKNPDPACMRQFFNNKQGI